MPSLKFDVNCDYVETFRSSKVVSMFDVPVEQKLTKKFDINLPIEEKPWQIGLIIGGSGSGKTTIAKQLFGEYYHYGYDWPLKGSFLDGFAQSNNVNEIVDALSHVGFSSPPNWLLPFHVLSNGQKFRAELARLLLEDKPLACIDEFTSVVDRTVAKIGCAAVQKAIRKSTKQIVAVSCHDDIIEWLQPDWVYNVDSNEFKWVCLRRPTIQLEIHKVSRHFWDLFKEYHYLSADINNAAQCYVAFYEGRPIAFTSYINFPHPTIKKTTKREHRTVVLPDFQGLGIGNKLSEFMAQLCIDSGYRFISTTGSPAMIHYRAKSKLWNMFREPKIVAPAGKKSQFKKFSVTRLTASFEYIGSK